MIQAVHNMLIVDLIEHLKQSTIICTEKERVQPEAWKAIVISVGPHYPYEVSPGDTIFVREREGVPIYDESLNKEYYAIREQWVLGVER